MIRLLLGGLIIASALPAAAQEAVGIDVRSLPMHFEWRREGPPDACGDNCRVWIAAAGAITVETPRDFEVFARANDVRGATLALDSSGGSVLAALALGRAIRALDITTTVGRTIEVSSANPNEARVTLSPQAECESMCAFVLLAGTRRFVPPESQVLVHQIWIGEKRDDPTAVTYSAEDVVLIERDIGRLARYTMDMGASSELIETALRIPPWERMRPLSREELRRTRLSTVDGLFEKTPSDATISAAPPTDGAARLAAITERGWSVVEKGGRPMLARRHPLTIEGEDIGSFDLMFACGDATDSYAVTYVEHRKNPRVQSRPEPLKDVAVSLGRNAAALKVISSDASSKTEMISSARGMVPATLVKAFASTGTRSLTVATSTADNAETAIRIGNTGIAQHFPKLVAACAK